MLAIRNRILGPLAEFGVIVAQSDLALRQLLADLDAQRELPSGFKELLRDLAEHWKQLRIHFDARAMHASKRTPVRTSGMFGCAPSSASARSPPMRLWPLSATHASSSRVGRWRRG